MLTVLAWLWTQPEGMASYTAQQVNIWADMVRRNLTLPHQIACVTAAPAGIDPSIRIIEPPGDFEDVEMPTWRAGKPQCLRRLAMFRPDAGRIFGERFVCMDLDCVIAGPLDPLFATSAEFKMFRGTAPERPYNGSMLLMTAGARPQVYQEITPERADEAGRAYCGSDQAWISYALGPGEPTWDAADGVSWWDDRAGAARHPDARLCFFLGLPKPWEVIDDHLDPWVSAHYRRSPSGRCLILGYDESVWRDAATARGPFAAVIASPEAARHWPGELLAIAQTDEHAERLALMHGLDPVFCGRQQRREAT